MSTLAYQYGLLDPLDWDQDCHEVLFRMNRLWNTLVQIERQHRTAYRQIVGADDAVAPLQAQLEALRTQQQGLRETRKARRQQARAKLATPEQDAPLKSLATQIQRLAVQCKAARREAKERCRKPVRALETERFEAVKVARNASGLWWGNYNAVCASYDTARTKAMKDGAELRFRRFTGEGRFTVQIIGGASFEELTTGVKQVALDLTPRPVPGRGGKARPRLSMTLYTKEGAPRMLSWPIVFDRALPENCRIQQVVVTRRRLGTHWRYAAVFTCRIADVPAVHSGGSDACGINLGFRTTSTGLRVAVLADQAGVHWPSDDPRQELSLEWMRGMDTAEATRQRRDLALNAIHAALRLNWPQRPPDIPESFGFRLGNLVRAPKFSPASLAAIVLRWRETPTWWPHMLARLEAWRAHDKKWFEIEAWLRDRLALARREQYRLFAHALASRYALIRIGAVDLRRMARLERPDGVETELHQRARRNRGRASLYLLQQEIERQADKAGAQVEYVEGPVTSTCHRCGSLCAVTADLIHVCEHCSAVWDQDENAARNIFAAPRERSNDDQNPGERSPLENQSDKL